MNLCWFNGPSARQFHTIPRQSTETGCNFIRKIRPVDNVCAFDQQCVDRIPTEAGVSYWTRRRCQTRQFQYFESEIPYYDSGTLALLVAAWASPEHIYVIGCDWWETDASIFDPEYDWRQHQPIKGSRDKQQIVMRLAQQRSITFVHPRARDYFGSDVKWIGPKAFLELF